MRQFGVVPLGMLLMLAATAAYAQTQVPAQRQVPETGGVVRRPEVPPPLVGPTVKPPPAVFSIGGMPVRVWTPVPPPYDVTADRNGAANPLWDDQPWWPNPLAPD